MSEIVFILGAGASRECGAPLMNDFLDKAKDLLSSNEVSGKKEHFERVFKAIASLQAVHSKSQLDLNNIESIFTAFEISNILNKLPQYLPNDIPELINSLKEVIVETLEQTIEIPLSKNQYEPPIPYGDFSKLLHDIRYNLKPKRRVSILTFNYDIALDLALHCHKLDYDYCLDETMDLSRIPLLKLHGSLNWGKCKICKKIIPWNFEKYFEINKPLISNLSPYRSSRIKIGTHLVNRLEHCSQKVESSPVIVPPSWNKVDQHKTLSNVWRQAANELGTAEFIFIIGYSLPETDAFFKLLFALGTLGDVPIRKITVFDPEVDGIVKNRFEKILGPGALAKFNYEKENFRGAIGSIHEILISKYIR